MDAVIKQVIDQFPDRQTQIRVLWAADEDFRELCQDYTLCLRILDHLAAEKAPQTRLNEYASLGQRLVLEIDLKTKKE